MQKIKLNTEEMIEKLSAKAKESGWKFLEWYFYQLDFISIVNELVNEVNNGHRFTPPMSYMFNGFFKCPYDKLKVVVIGQDPYPKEGVADGISFSCSRTMKVQPSLRYIFKAIDSDLHYGYEGDPDLTRWAEQGVLMLNTALTCRVNNVGSHYHLWDNFTKHLLEHLNKYKKELIIVLLGKKAESWGKYLKNHQLIKVSHPASAVYSGGVWDSRDMFNKVNDHLYEIGESEIKW